MSIRSASEDGKDPKNDTELLDEVEMAAANNTKPVRTLEAPPLVQAMSAEDRIRVERALVRKVDFRLLPPIIIMYIMVCRVRQPSASEA